MKTINIKKGKDILLKGAAEKRLIEAIFPEYVAVKPVDFYGLRARVIVKEGAAVQAGTPVLEDKDDARIKIVSPVSGKVSKICRGEKRKLLEIVIQTDKKQDACQLTKFSPVQIPGLSRKQIVAHLLETGSWAFLRQRPFDHIANPDIKPKSIFIKGIDTNPLAIDYDVALEGKDEELLAGLELLSKLTDGPLYLCISKNVSGSVLTQHQTSAQTVIIDGHHPAGNVSTHIHQLDPINHHDVVWYLDAQDVVAMAESFLTGNFCSQRVVAVGGEKADQKIHQQTIRGVGMASLIDQESFDDTRVISGSVLSGEDIGGQGFLGFYDTQVSLIPRGGKRELLGWTMPGLTKFSLSRTFLSALNNNKKAVIDSDIRGSLRAIVFNDAYDKYVALDIMTFFLIRAIFAGEIEEMERLGILECAPEDFALASFACPSKVDLCGIIQQGLELIEQEG